MYFNIVNGFMYLKVTIDGITYEGTVDEIREIVRNPPTRSTETPPLNFPKE